MDVEALAKVMGPVCAVVGVVWWHSWRASRTWARLENAVTANSAVTEKTAAGVERLTEDMTMVKFVLSGPDGENGLRSDMREVKQRVGSLEVQLGIPPTKPERRSRKRRRTDD